MLTKKEKLILKGAAAKHMVRKLKFEQDFKLELKRKRKKPKQEKDFGTWMVRGGFSAAALAPSYELLFDFNNRSDFPSWLLFVIACATIAGGEVLKNRNEAVLGEIDEYETRVRQEKEREFDRLLLAECPKEPII